MRAVLSLVLVALVFQMSSAQNIREEKLGHGVTRRAGERAATKLGINKWPHVSDGEKGTQVHISFDYKNSDIVLLSFPAPGRDKMLAVGRRISQAIHMPDADYIFVHEITYGSIDVELNKYLKTQGKSHSINIDLDALARTLNDSPELPKPILIRIEADDADSTTLAQQGHINRALSNSSFYELTALRGASLEYSATLTWVAYAAATFFCLFLVGVLAFIVRLPWAHEKLKLKQAQRLAEKAAEPKSPEEVQRLYDKSKPGWMTMIFIALPMLIMFGGSTIFEPAMHQAFRLLPVADFDPRLALLVPIMFLGVPFGLSQVIYLLDRRRRLSKNPALAEVLRTKDPASQAASPFAFLGILFLPIPLMVALTFIPGFYQINPALRRAIIFGVMFGGFALAGYLLIKLQRKQRVERKAGDWVYDAAQSYANAAGIKLRRVETRISPAANAYATLFGTVGVTSTLLEKFEPEEVKTVVAHEIGHLAARHLKKLVPISLASSLAIIAIYDWGVGKLEGRVPETVYRLLDGPFFVIFFLPLLSSFLFGGRRRKYETEADRFAAEVTGDPELVIRTLTKIHVVNERPHRLKPVDEALSSHPSLENRIRALRGERGGNSKA